LVDNIALHILITILIILEKVPGQSVSTHHA
jgi:hypothetical protein